MYVTVRTFGLWEEKPGICERAVLIHEHATIGELLVKFTSQYNPDLKRQIVSEDGAVSSAVTVLINGQSVHTCGGLKRTLRDGDVVTILPVIWGG